MRPAGFRALHQLVGRQSIDFVCGCFAEGFLGQQMDFDLVNVETLSANVAGSVSNDGIVSLSMPHSNT